MGKMYLLNFSGDWDVHWGYGILTHGQMGSTGLGWFDFIDQGHPFSKKGHLCPGVVFSFILCSSFSIAQCVFFLVAWAAVLRLLAALALHAPASPTPLANPNPP